MDFSYNLPLLLEKHVKVLKVRYKKNKLLRGRLGLVLDPLLVVLSLVFIGRVLESHSRLKRSSQNICLMESDWGKQVVQSTFGIVKHGGVTPINLGKSRLPP
ncbi:unnamed protein product [Prunus brigantina]